ncbi:MAG: phosphoglycerate mutase [Micavibrio sp.]|nr:phosphoglycerate mutase [Micavibrio sp.]|tara:strand:- start:2474 stop:3010 length:537 start_codon:yes stop_codon:yes gene_type:complete
MKKLYILRHAKAATPEHVRDFDRPLAKQGLDDAARLGAVITERGYIPDLVLCSPARRTRETLDTLNLPDQTSIQFIEKIYDATAGDILNMIQDTDDKMDAIMLVGHNPAIHELALRLSSEDSGLSYLQRLLQGYSPATLSVIDIPCTCWNDIQLGQNYLVDLQTPLDYNAPDRPTRWM